MVLPRLLFPAPLLPRRMILLVGGARKQIMTQIEFISLLMLGEDSAQSLFAVMARTRHTCCNLNLNQEY